MSHFTKCDRAKIVDPDAFEDACKTLGLTDIRKNEEMRGYMGNKKAADVMAGFPGGRYDVGIIKNEQNGYDLVADFWGVNCELPKDWNGERTETGIQDAIIRETARHTVMRQLEQEGFMGEVEESADHSLTLTLTRY